MKPDLIYDHIERLLNSYGFNIVTKVKAVAYKKQIKTSRKLDGLLKDAESIILVGFAGKEFWEILQIYLEENPGFKIRSEDWIDEYTKLRFRSVAGFLDENKSEYDMVFPFGPTAFQLDFMKLGKLAGVGVDSLLGVLINPEYGPWISLRGAIINNLEFNYFDKPLKDFDPCPSCSKPCISACPANTVSSKGWDWEACMKYRLTTDTCETNCASRRACPYGEEHQYTEEQLAHHHKFVLRSVRKHRSKLLAL